MDSAAQRTLPVSSSSSVIAGSTVVAAWEAISRLVHPQGRSTDLGWVAAAEGHIGFLGNELAAKLPHPRRTIRSAAATLVADGHHARIDGFTSLAVVLRSRRCRDRVAPGRPDRRAC